MVTGDDKMSDEPGDRDDVEHVLDRVLEKVGFKTLVKLVPDGEGGEADDNINAMLSMMGLKKGKLVAEKGKLVAVIDSKDLYGKDDRIPAVHLTLDGNQDWCRGRGSCGTGQCRGMNPDDCDSCAQEENEKPSSYIGEME